MINRFKLKAWSTLGLILKASQIFNVKKPQVYQTGIFVFNVNSMEICVSPVYRSQNILLLMLKITISMSCVLLQAGKAKISFLFFFHDGESNRQTLIRAMVS